MIRFFVGQFFVTPGWAQLGKTQRWFKLESQRTEFLSTPYQVLLSHISLYHGNPSVSVSTSASASRQGQAPSREISHFSVPVDSVTSGAAATEKAFAALTTSYFWLLAH